MSTRILKYTLHERGVALLPLPSRAILLHVDDQDGALQLWVQANPELPLETHYFAVLFTGFDEVPPGALYVGTVLSSGGNFVRHVYEVTPA